MNRDVKPFVCLSEQCRWPVLFFTRMEQWIEHMNKMHSHEWTRTIHSASWICDTGHDAIQFTDVESFREHMDDKGSHPMISDEHNLHVLEIEQWRHLPHDEYACPLCDFTLDMPKESISAGVAGCELYRPLHEHIAGHLKDLAVLSLPILDATEEREIPPDNHKATDKGNWPIKGKKESRPRGYNQEVCHTFVSDVQTSIRASQEHDYLKRRKSEACPTTNSFDDKFVTYTIRGSFDEEFRNCCSPMQVYTGYKS